MENYKANNDILVKQIKSKLKNSSDIINRTIYLMDLKIELVYIQDITSYDIISNYIIKPITECEEIDKNNIIDDLTNNIVAGREVKVEEDIDTAVEQMLKGKVAITIQGETSIILVDASKFLTRSISEPPTSSVLLGPREGFNESIKNNINMVRRRLATPNLKVTDLQVGKETKTAVTLMYLSDIADVKVVDLVKKRINEIDIDGIVDSFYIGQFLQEKKHSIFKQVGNSEKPDIITAKLLEGRIAIFVDGSPIVLTVPFILEESFQNSEDYYTVSYHATFVRWLRTIGVAFAVLLPGGYVALQLYHYGIIPLKFLVTIANSIDGLPFTPLFEILFVILLFELLNEASLRMPQYLGMAMSIVGALILGDTAVKAGLVSPPAVMIIALSSLTVFIVTDLANQLSILRLGFVIIGAVLGFYGIIIGIVFLIAYLNTMDSYGAPYLAPLSPRIKNDFKDFITKDSLEQMVERPYSIPNKNKRRQK